MDRSVFIVRFKRIIGSTFVFIALGLVLLYFMQMDTVDNPRNIQFIKDHMYNGEILDMQNEVSVESADDIKWYYLDGKEIICIEYGKVLLKYKMEDFIKPETIKDLNDVLITVKQNKETLEFTLYFDGEELPRYVKKSSFGSIL